MEWEKQFDKQTAEYLPDLKIVRDEPMSRHTSFRIGGPADVFIQPKTERAICETVRAMRENDIPLTVLGLSLIHI